MLGSETRISWKQPASSSQETGNMLNVKAKVISSRFNESAELKETS